MWNWTPMDPKGVRKNKRLSSAALLLWCKVFTYIYGGCAGLSSISGTMVPPHAPSSSTQKHVYERLYLKLNVRWGLLGKVLECA